MIIDEYGQNDHSPSYPANDAAPLVPSDTEDPEFRVTRAIYVGSGGALALVTMQGTTVILQNVTGGTILPIRVQQVLATGTTASALVGLY